MEQRSNDVAAKDVPIMPSKEECVGSTEQSSNDAAAKDVQMEPSKEECAEGMEQSRQRKQQCRSEGCNNAVIKVGVCIKHTGQRRNANYDCSNFAQQERKVYECCSTRRSVQKAWGQSSNNVNVAPSMDVPFMPSEEECAEGCSFDR